jgi:ABC-type multidrug transport system fused ATPase/permease subunit
MLGLVTFILAAYPQAGAACIAVIGLFNRRPPVDRLIEVSILGWTLTRAVFHWRAEGSPVIGILEGVFAWMLFRGVFTFSTLSQRRTAVLGTVFGLFVATIIGVVVPLVPGWIVERAIIESSPLSSTLRVVPTDVKDDYVYRILDVRRPGRLTYSLEVRADQPHRLALLISSTALPGRFAAPSMCDVDRMWKTCSISADLPGPGTTLFIVGGFASWKRGDPALELRNPRLVEGGVPTLLEQLASLPRISGLSINPNIFGGSASVLAALAFVISPNARLQALVGGIALVAIVLSGSRTAMIALIFAMSACIALRLRGRYGLMVFVVGLMLLVAIQFGGFSTLLGRVAGGYKIEQGSNLQRLYQLEMARQAFLESPWLGVGNLRTYFVDHLDDQGRKLGLTSSTLAHAHNLVLQTAGEGGALGLIGLAMIWGAVVLRVVRRRDYGGLVVLVVIALINTFDYLFYYSSVQVGFWAVAAGIGSRAYQQTDHNEEGISR